LDPSPKWVGFHGLPTKWGATQEEWKRGREKEVYEKLKHKLASAQRGNGDMILEPNFLQKDLKPAQIVRLLAASVATTMYFLPVS